MPLPQPREGDSYGFKTHVGWSQHLTLGSPEISPEYQLTYGNPSRLVELVDPDLLVDVNANEIWIRFSAKRGDLKSNRLTRNTFLNMITVGTSDYQTVSSEDEFLWTFELRNPKGNAIKLSGIDYHGPILIRISYG